MEDTVQLTSKEVNQLVEWALNVALPAFKHFAKDGYVGDKVCGQNDYCDAISFYKGLKITPQRALDELPSALAEKLQVINGF